LDQASQERIIEKHAEKLKELTERIPGNFGEEDIHDWRVEYKKLRAFLRMITAGINGHVPLMNDEIKKIYSSAGVIRELQLYRGFLEAAPEINLPALPIYDALLQRKLFSAKEEFIKRIDIFWYEKEFDRWRVMVPGYLSVAIVKQFLQQRITAIRLILLAPDTDKSLHSIRKHVKDIIYNVRTFTNQWGIPFPVVAWKNEKLLAEVADELGKYNDRCSILSFVEPEVIDQLPSEEKEQLSAVRALWTSEKEKVRIELVQQVCALELYREVKEIK